MLDLAPHAIAILIVDDHSLFRESVARLLAAEPGFAVVGHCATIEQALEAVRQHPVDLVLLDFDLGRGTGTEFLRLARQRGFRGKVLVVTAGVDEREAASLIQSGVSGIFMKHDSALLLAQGIRDVMAGRGWFDRQLLQGAFADSRVCPDKSAARFTQRERQVLSHVFEGRANKEIAGEIGVSESSVKAILQQLFAKTGVRTRSQLVRITLEHFRHEL